VYFFEIDAFIPVREEFEFLRKRCFKSTVNLGDGFHIKRPKLRGQVSQGLSLPLSDFFQQSPIDGRYFLTPDVGLDGDLDWLQEGMDVTEYFKIQKYEKPIGSGSGMGPMNAIGSFRASSRRLTRNVFRIVSAASRNGYTIRNPLSPKSLCYRSSRRSKAGTVENTEVTQYFKSGEQWFQRNALRNEEHVIMECDQFEVSLKLDGSSMTVYHNDGTLGVCSRNFDLRRDNENVFWRRPYSLIYSTGWFRMVENLAFQGELMGPRIQGNRENLDRNKFFRIRRIRHRC